jgi:AcrR family transcriptional regulator
MLARVKNQKQARSTLSREKWLGLAIKVLATDCRSKFSLDSLIQAMPVTKGSFYSHFKDRTDFLLALIDYWYRHDTKSIIDTLEHLSEHMAPEDRLWELTLAIYDRELYHYELLLRVLSFEFPETRGSIQKVDRRRIDTIRGLFAEMGFEGVECEVRARTYVTVISQEHCILEAVPEEELMKYIRERHRFFTRPGVPERNLSKPVAK